MKSRAQIIATIGPASEKPETLRAMIESGMDLARLNFAWASAPHEAERIERIRAIAKNLGRTIHIIADLPGPRVQKAEGHTYDALLPAVEKDEEALRFCAQMRVEYVALSFVGNAEDVWHCREAIKRCGGSQKIIAKIERQAAVEAFEDILAAADAVMVARGDLGAEVPLEQIPFVQKMIVEKANAAGKPVIVATEMLLSMTEHPEPTRAEVTDVEEAVTEGADAVMLSEETASGRYPKEAVAMMERILIEAERHGSGNSLNPL